MKTLNLLGLPKDDELSCDAELSNSLDPQKTLNI